MLFVFSVRSVCYIGGGGEGERTRRISAGLYVLENGTAGTSYALFCALRTLAMSDVRNKNSLRLLKSSAVARNSSRRAWLIL